MSDIGNSYLFGTGRLDPVTGEPALNLLPIVDFRGGLNLAGEFALRSEESPEMLNVDPLPNGGICRRNAVQAWSLPATDPIRELAMYQPEGGTAAVYGIAEPGEVWRFTENTAAATAIVVGSQANMIQISDLLYVYQKGTGTTVIDSAQATEALTWLANDGQWSFSDTAPYSIILVDDDGNPITPIELGFPDASTVAAAAGHVWAAGVSEPGDPTTQHPNRVYWSAPATDDQLSERMWSSEDYVDVDAGRDGDFITALVECAGNLYVFKNHSIYRIVIDENGVRSVVEVSSDLGAASPRQIACYGSDVFFWDRTSGLHGMNNSTIVSLFDRLQPLLDADIIRPNHPGSPTVGVVNGRIFVSLPEKLTADAAALDGFDGSANNNEPTVTYVFDPAMGSEGAWSKYSYGVRAHTIFRPSGDKIMPLASITRRSPTITHSLVQLDSIDGITAIEDEFSDGETTPFVAFWRSSWVYGDNPYVGKRFERPQMIAEKIGDATGDFVFELDVHGDWNPDTVINQGDITFFGADAASAVPATEIKYPGDDPTDVCPTLTPAVPEAVAPTGNRTMEKQHGPQIGGTPASLQLLVRGPGNHPWCLSSVLVAYTEEEFCG